MRRRRPEMRWRAIRLRRALVGMRPAGIWLRRAGMGLRRPAMVGKGWTMGLNGGVIPGVWPNYFGENENSLLRNENFSELAGMKNILNRGFSELSLNSFVALVAMILSKLEDNPYFPTTTPTLASVGTQFAALKQTMLIVDPEARTEAIKAARATLEQTLDDLGDNLELTANMDPVKLATTGFGQRKETSQTGQPPTVPENPRLRRTGTTGEAQLLCQPSDRARGYEVQTAPSPEGPWTTYETFSSTRNMVLHGFERAKDLWVRTRAIGPNNTKSAWSNPVSILID